MARRKQCTFRKTFLSLCLTAILIASILLCLVIYRDNNYQESKCIIVDNDDCKTEEILEVVGKNWNSTVSTYLVDCQEKCCQKEIEKKILFDCLRLKNSDQVIEINRDDNVEENIWTMIWTMIGVGFATGSAYAACVFLEKKRLNNEIIMV